jgi:hypothetical protein
MKLSKTLFTIFASLTISSFANAQTGIKMAGNVSFRATPSGSSYVWTGNVTEVRNYDYSDASGLRLAIVASKSCARSGNLIGTVAAKSSSFNLPARTYVTGVRASGRTKRLNQKLCVHGLILDSSNFIRDRILIGNYKFRSVSYPSGQLANSENKLRFRPTKDTTSKFIAE